MSLKTLFTGHGSTRYQPQFHIQPHPLTLIVLLSTLIHQSIGRDSEIRNNNKNKLSRIDFQEKSNILNLNHAINDAQRNNIKENSIENRNYAKFEANDKSIPSETLEIINDKNGDTKNFSQEHTENLKHNPNQAKSRQKRVLWLTEDGRLALPPGTTMVITPSLSMPFVRYPPEGFFSNMTISLPFTIDFNKLGLTDNENPYGVLPPVLARSMGRAAGGILADYIGNLFEHRRGKRSPETRPPAPPHSKTGHFHGGERALLFVAVEDLLENFGLDGKACLLRAICEVHAHPMKGFGLVGEMLKLFLSASMSPYSDLMKDYVEAENAGKGGDEGHGECWPYMRDCPKSLFLIKHNKYSEDIQENEISDDNFQHMDKNQQEKVTYDPSIRNM